MRCGECGRKEGCRALLPSLSSAVPPDGAGGDCGVGIVGEDTVDAKVEEEPVFARGVACGTQGGRDGQSRLPESLLGERNSRSGRSRNARVGCAGGRPR